MAKNKAGKHIRFYIDCLDKKRMPESGLCACSWYGLIDEDLLIDFKPELASHFSYWASGRNIACYYKFTKLRQTIVLFMAAINNEL